MSSGREAADKIRSIIDEAFAQPLAVFREEIQTASALSRVDFAQLRPVFISGTPEDVPVRGYVIFLGLNPKLDVKSRGNTAHYAKIDAGPRENAAVTLGYFSHMETLHPYFNRRAPVVRAMAEAMGTPCGGDNRSIFTSNAPAARQY